MAKNTRTALVPVEHIADSIVVLRGHRVIIDHDLAVIYGVSTGRLNEAVKRNAKRFPADFMFQLTTEESANLKSHFAISSWGGRRYSPNAFTEHVRSRLPTSSTARAPSRWAFTSCARS